uniref:DAGKc domain-containing protein n=1 Tax=Panagrolaimus sp. JU765 TaxID=591449 RepID=A0AC34QIE2_9BILA
MLDLMFYLSAMERIRKIGTTLYNHKKKAIFAALVAAYGVNYGRLMVQEADIRAFYAKQALKYGEETISSEVRPRRITVLVNKKANAGTGLTNFKKNALPLRITVLVNKKANAGTGLTNFKKNALPLLNLAGIAVNVITVENAEQLKSLGQVLDFTEADGILLVGGDGSLNDLLTVGGDGSLNDLLTGIVQKADDSHILPVGVFPGGRCNKSLRLLVPNVFRQTDDVRHQCESAMAVVEESIRKIKPIKVEITSVVENEPETKNESETKEAAAKAEETPGEIIPEIKTDEPQLANVSNQNIQYKKETIYTIGDISDGWFAYIEEKKWKFWYWGALRWRFAYFWEMLKNYPQEIRAEIEVTDYCSGCNKCRTTKLPPPPAWRWWHILTGPPKSAKSDPNQKNYSQIVNEECGRKTEMCAQGTDVVIVGEQHEDACSLRLRVGGTFAGRLGIMREGWARVNEDYIISSPTSGFYGTDLITSCIKLKMIECPEKLRKLFVAGEIKGFEPEKAVVEIAPIEKSIPLFVPRNIRISLDAL